MKKLLIILFFYCIQVFSQDSLLHIKSTKEVGQIEVGSPYLGIEIHKSFPMLNRISFYYPFANSIDVSTDYWKRENFRIMSVGLKVGDSPKQIFENEVYEVDQTPYSVSFTKEKYESEIKISYKFCKNESAMVVTYQITNNSETEKDYEVYTRLETILRTSHSYNLKDKAYTEFEKKGPVIRINYPEKETGNCQVFIANAGEYPSSFTTASDEIGYRNLDDWWINTNSELPGKIIPEINPSKPVAAFIYHKKLKPKESIKIVQIIGSSLIKEGKEKTDYLLKNYKREVQEYENYIVSESIKKNPIFTGNNDLDFTSIWSKAVLAVNKHYINGEIVPMPAPAEYNFYFTHDVLLTDLAAVNFDLDRVKKDLKFIISLADKDKIIPHAYYWKDSLYKTELAGTENWNHFWFTLVCARYLRHSNDKEFINQLYPYVAKSVETALKNKGEDDLMWSFRPDWWDIGNNFGPRAYMTILAIRALREFNFISASLGRNISQLKYYDELANRINKNLVGSLWDDSLNYLISYYNDGTEDKHIYMGSMLASHFNLLDADKNLELIKTAEKKLLDENIGIYTLYPMDLNKLIEFMGFAGNEAGDPYYYANGGIWPHGNAWYALGLINNGFKKEALNFIKRTMTLNGTMKSPNGQPALYEYRISDKNNREVYGKIDKPQFLWAGGWYFYTLYNLLGLRENEWNISFDPYIPDDLDSLNLSVTINGNPVDVKISGKGKEISSILYNKKQLASAVVSNDINNLSEISIQLGETKTPYLSSANAIVYSPDYNEELKTLEFDLESFEENLLKIEIISPVKIKNIFMDEKEIQNEIKEEINDKLYKINFQNKTKVKKNNLKITFN